MFYSNTLPFLLEWNSYSHIPKPLNLVPNLPGRPSLHVPSNPNINSSTMSVQTHTHTGSQRGERGAHAFVLVCTIPASGGKKQRGFGRLGILAFQVASLIIAWPFPYTPIVFIWPQCVMLTVNVRTNFPFMSLLIILGLYILPWKQKGKLCTWMTP